MDAQRNRERILEIARELFTQLGPATTLDEVARRAEVGPGTLYRHFPTREQLIEAVFRSEVDKLVSAAERFSNGKKPVDALRAWMLLFIEYVSSKLLILPVMDTVPGGSAGLIEGTRTVIHSTFRTLIERAIRSGELDPATEPDDLVRALIGVFHTTALPGWEQSARRIVEILLRGAGPQ